MLIRKVPTERADLPRLLCGSFGTLSREVRSAPTGSGQSDGANAQHLASSIIAPLLLSKLSPHLSAPPVPSLALALLVELRTSWTGYCFARPKLKQRHSARRFINKEDPARENRWVDEGVMHQSALQKECPHHLLYHPPPLQFYLLPQQ